MRREMYDVCLDVLLTYLDIFETQKEQKKQKSFHKRLLYVLRFTDMLQKAKNFCKKPFVPFVFQKYLGTLAARLGTRHTSHF